MMMIRKYQSQDCKQLSKLFYGTVHCVNAKDYTVEQLNDMELGNSDGLNCKYIEL